MSKNIEMNYKGDGGYEVVYPKTDQSLVINLINDDTKELMGLSNSATANDAFKTAYLSAVLSEKAMVEITFTESSSGLPASDVIVTCSAWCDGSGTPLESMITNQEGKIVGFVNAINPTIKIQGYADIEDFSQQLQISALGKQYSFSFQVIHRSSLDILSASSYLFSSLSEKIDVCVVGGGGGGGGALSYYRHSAIVGGGGGGGGYVQNLLNYVHSINTTYQFTIGSGGDYGRYSSSVDGYRTVGGAKGGSSSFSLNQSAIITAEGGGGGQGGNTDVVGYGGVGNGNGGNGHNYGYNTDNDTTTNPTNGTVYKFNEIELGLAGGGGGGAGGCRTKAINPGALPNGGNSGYQSGTSYSQLPKNGKQAGGGGGGGSAGTQSDQGQSSRDFLQNGAAGGKGAIYLRMHLKST